MARFTRPWRPLLAVVGLAMLAAGADQGSPPAAAAPQLAGAWYQVFFDTDRLTSAREGRSPEAAVGDVVSGCDDHSVALVANRKAR